VTVVPLVTPLPAVLVLASSPLTLAWGLRHCRIGAAATFGAVSSLFLPRQVAEISDVVAVPVPNSELPRPFSYSLCVRTTDHTCTFVACGGFDLGLGAKVPGL
jgi:hypothetical protein